MNGVAQGDGYYERDGNIIAMKSIQCKIQFYSYPVTGGASVRAPGSVFIALVLDRQPNTVLAGSELIFQNPCNNLVGSAGGCMQISALSRRRFKILRSTTVKVPRTAVWDTDTNTATHGSGMTHLDWFIDLKGRKVVYVGATGHISSIQTNALLLVAFGWDEANTAGAADWSNISLTHNTRLRFVG